MVDQKIELVISERTQQAINKIIEWLTEPLIDRKDAWEQSRSYAIDGIISLMRDNPKIFPYANLKADEYKKWVERGSGL